MKKWILLLAMLVLLTACGSEQAPEALYEPYGLEIEYGDCGVAAMVGAYAWNSEGYTGGEDAPDPRDKLSEVPFVNEAKDKKLELKFEEKPDRLEISLWSSKDGYTSNTAVDSGKKTLTAPDDGASYLYEIRAFWDQDEKGSPWGECSYYFRYLPADASGEQERETTLFRVMQMGETDLFGIVMTNHLDGQQKTGTNADDKQAVLDYLKGYLITSFVPMEAGEIDYELRIACTDGTELSLAYGSNGVDTWLVVNGTSFEAEVMDLYSLWKQLKAEPVPLEAASDYLQTAEDFPGEDWGEDYRHGYVRALDDRLTFDEMLWIDDSTQPNGYLLEAGQTGQTLPVAEDCQFWILEEHYTPFCQVTAETLLQWNQSADWDILYRIYLKDGAVIAVCEAYMP